MTKPDKPTMQSLYQQRREQHKMPASLQAKLKKQQPAPRRHSLKRWLTLAPGLASAALVILILQPQWMTDTTSMADSVMPSPEPATLSAPKPQFKQSEPSAVAREAAPLFEESNVPATESAKSAAELTPAPLAGADNRMSASAVAEESEAFVSDDLSRADVMPIEPERFSTPVTVKILTLDPPTGLTCNGEQLTLPEITDQSSGQWVSVVWREEQWVINSLEVGACP